MHKVFDKFETGQLRQVLTIQEPPSGTGSRGERTGDWSDVATVRARVETLSGDEIIQAHQLAGMCSHRVTIRYKSGLDIRQRFKFGSRYLNFVFINNVEECNRLCLILCREDV
jgi:SPP1 family predicted phage head-tail adaptor